VGFFRQLKSPKLWIATLLLAVIFVTFILPSLVSEPWLTPGDANNPPKQPTAAQTAPLAPSVIAEKIQYRQDSQTVLASIIQLRDQLTAQGVARWAQVQFQNALTAVDQGDKAYRSGDYQQSLNSYHQALDQLQQLQQLAQQTLQQALTDGEMAIQRANPEDIPLAQESATLTMAIAPDNSQSVELNRQVSQFPPLVDALFQGDRQFQQKQYQQAKKAYQSALAIDPSHQRAQRGLEDTLGAIDRQNFLAQMSEGYKALQAEDFAAALSAFAEAKAIDNSDLSVQSAQQAIAETQSRQQQMAIDRQMDSAVKFAQQEQWQQAQQVYRQLLEDDPSLVDTKVKLIPVAIRAQLDQQLVSLLDDPLALADKAIYAKATAWLADAQGIANPGPRLQNQIQQLEILIQRATLPISVSLVSDNQTEVTIYKVAKLGTFARQTVALTPGRYTIVGSRRGYRDMRIELTLEGDRVEPIMIRCTERI